MLLKDCKCTTTELIIKNLVNWQSMIFHKIYHTSLVIIILEFLVEIWKVINPRLMKICSWEISWLSIIVSIKANKPVELESKFFITTTEQCVHPIIMTGKKNPNSWETKQICTYLGLICWLGTKFVFSDSVL